MATANKCPRCELYNPPTALRCDCGYDFRSGQIKDSYLSSSSDLQRLQDLLVLFFGLAGYDPKYTFDDSYVFRLKPLGAIVDPAPSRRE